MFRPRVIPCLLLKNSGLVKSIKFKDYRYIGDPINAVRIFNEKKADELIFLDITATREKREPNLKLIQEIGEECLMPFAVGGGIHNLDQIKKILHAGAEKVAINTTAFKNPEFIKQASEKFGSQSIIVSIDVKKNFWGKQTVYIRSGAKSTGIEPIDFAKKMEEMGAGEILINSIDRDGTMSGYDIDLIKTVSDNVTIPVIAIGGAGKLDDLKAAIGEGKASAIAAGSLFVFHGRRNGVLINFPTRQELLTIFSNSVNLK